VPSSPHAITRTLRVSRRASAGARLLKHVFDFDVEQCPNCGGALKIIAAIEDPPVIVKILRHLGLPTRAARRVPRRSASILSKRPESRNRLPTQSIAAARCEFERVARRRANRALPTAAPPELAGAKPRFSLNSSAIDTLGGWALYLRQ